MSDIIVKVVSPKGITTSIIERPISINPTIGGVQGPPGKNGSSSTVFFTGNYYPTDNPSGFFGTGQILKYSTFLNSGVETQFISYPFQLQNKPSTINYNLENNRDQIIY